MRLSAEKSKRTFRHRLCRTRFLVNGTNDRFVLVRPVHGLIPGRTLDEPAQEAEMGQLSLREQVLPRLIAGAQGLERSPLGAGQGCTGYAGGDAADHGVLLMAVRRFL